MKIPRLFYSSLKRGIDTTPQPLWGYRGCRGAHPTARSLPDPAEGLSSPPAPQQPWQPLQTAPQGFLLLQHGSCSTRSEFISGGWAVSTGLAPRASFSTESKLNTAGTAGDWGLWLRGCASAARGTRQRQHQGFQALPSPTRVPCCPQGVLSYCWGRSCPPGHTTAL